jgi:hypothetical protein
MEQKFKKKSGEAMKTCNSEQAEKLRKLEDVLREKEEQLRLLSTKSTRHQVPLQTNTRILSPTRIIFSTETLIFC